MEVAAQTTLCKLDQTLHTLAVAEAAGRLTEERTAVMVALAVAALALALIGRALLGEL
jgi:hypothetical protein